MTQSMGLIRSNAIAFACTALITTALLTALNANDAKAANDRAQSITRYGSSQAEACFHAADHRTDLHGGLAICEQALKEEVLRARDRAATLVNRGIIKMFLRDGDGALADYNAGLALQPDLGDGYINRGLLYLQQGNRDAQALAEMSKGISLGSRDEAAARYGRAFAYEAVGQVKEAYLDFKRAVELKPDWKEAQQELARFTVQRGQ